MSRKLRFLGGMGWVCGRRWSATTGCALLVLLAPGRDVPFEADDGKERQLDEYCSRNNLHDGRSE